MQGSLTSHAVCMANGYVSNSMNHRIQKSKMEGDYYYLLKISGIGDGLEASHLTQSTALCISSYDAMLRMWLMNVYLRLSMYKVIYLEKYAITKSSSKTHVQWLCIRTSSTRV